MYGKVPGQPRIGFRDRPLNKGEKYHHYCVECGVELHADLAYTRDTRRNPLIIIGR